MNPKRTAIGLLGSALALSLLTPVGIASAAPPAPGQAATDTVTLITGDKVILNGSVATTVIRAKGREHTRFIEQRDQFGDLHVIPEDVTALLRDKRMDPRLFNVTKLAQTGFGDSVRKDTPLIVSGGPSFGAKVRDLPSVQGSAVRLDKASGAHSFTSAQRIWLDGPVRATDDNITQIGAPEAWKLGYQGQGTTVAVLDSGVDATHPDLAGAVADSQDFTGSATGTDDYFGHGTHVASIITGEHPKYGGVAPDTKLLNGKVLGDEGTGSESGIIAGMQWAVSKGAKVVNMSLGSPFPSDGTDPFSLAVNDLTAKTGTLFVIASGNSGGAIGSPGAADAALTVGAVDHNDQLAPFSSRGPRSGDGAIKPDITAPGVDIVAARAAHAKIGVPVDATHMKLSGTSMATPHVAGAAAILAGEHPDWKADQLKNALMGSAKPNPALSVFEQGAGRLDVAKAVTQNVYASVPNLNEGTAQWPHNDDTPITKTVTYHNSGSTPVTLDMTTDIKDPAGHQAPSGMFTVAPSTLTIPAGGDAEATVTTDTRVNAPDGVYNGVVLGGGVRTPITVTREVESYNVTMTFLDFDGQPTPNYGPRFVDIDHPMAYLPYDPSGTVVARLPKGRFYLDTYVQSADYKQLAIVNEPEYKVTGDATMTIDARTAKPVAIQVDKPNAKPGQAVLRFIRKTAFEGGTGNGYILNNFDGFFVRPSQTSAAPGQFQFYAEARMAEPDANGSFNNSPYLYNVRAQTDGKIPDTLVTRVRDSDLTKVRSEHGSTSAGKFGRREETITKPLPYSLDEFYTPNVPWTGMFRQVVKPDDFESESAQEVTEPRTFKPGHTTERWNVGVFGPGMPTQDGVGFTALRLGDLTRFALSMFTQPGPGRLGSAVSTGVTTLSKDGQQVATVPTPGFALFSVPPGPGTYQLHVESLSPQSVSTNVTADWTFKSDTVAGVDAKGLPLIAVRFAPTLDDQSRASRYLPTVVPVSIDHNTGGKAKVTGIQVSYDQGRTWRPAPVVTLNGRTFTVLVHPANAKSVSLKASASDTDGNTVDQTIIDSFLLK
ncbi:S8 family serine peptidase [Actinocrispum wychmicini]|uniref:Subtilase family protein n=1 Tax=Actinocrispum wychmicini TaxID=1213861 RepID=A0A4V2S8X8_9PSEU|nr:S8 family serine peptidase [Actinocrispum wychmicini]TCO65470.1 subtilase family protein [Actinocrispum wychmicini]